MHEMDKLDVLEELLPGFQQFLSDLTTCRLSSALTAQVDKYNKSIKDYCATILKPAPEPPSDPGVNGNIEKFLAEERARSRMTHTAQGDTYYNVNINTDASSSSDVMEQNYEEPTRSPTVPTTKRPPLRQIDDLPNYEDPDEPPLKSAGKSATMPLPSRYTEPSDSGGTLMSFNSSSSSYQPDENYEDLPDYDNFGDGDDDEFSSTDYEDYDDDEIIKQNAAGVDANANKAKSKPEKAKLDQEDRLAHFKKRHESDPKVDHVGLLYIPNKIMTISKKSKEQWTKRYCLARDARLLGYKNHDAKKASQNVVLSGYSVAYVGTEGRQQNVFSISHPNRGVEMFGAESREDADKWIEVLQGYAALKIEQEGPSKGDEFSKKVLGWLRNKKSKESSPQLSVDGKGVLSGCINIMGAKFGDPKWRKKFLMISGGKLECWSEDGETLHFEFPLSGIEMCPVDPKVFKRKEAIKISKNNETLIYLETLNHLDMGPLLKVFVEAMTDPKKDPSSLAKTNSVSKLLKAFESQSNEPAELTPDRLQTEQKEEELYEDAALPTLQKSQDNDKAESTTKISSIYQNFKIYINIPVAKTIDEDLYLELLDDFEKPTITSSKEKKKKKNLFAVMQRDNRKRSETLPAKISKMPEEPAADSKKDKKAKKKEDKKKKDKKGKGKEEVAAKGEEVVVKEKEPTVEETPKKRQSIRAKTAFDKSDNRHMLDVDRLEIERKQVDTKKREATLRKIKIGGQKRETTDPKQKEALEAEYQKAQQEFSECSRRLASIDSEIERLKGGDAKKLQEQKQDSASAEVLGNGFPRDADKKEDKGSTSPGMKAVQRRGNVKDKMQMFQQMGNK